MSTRRPVPLKIELQASDTHVTGKLTDERGEGHAFSTWLHLLTLLERARLRSLCPDGHPTQPPDLPNPNSKE